MRDEREILRAMAERSVELLERVVKQQSETVEFIRRCLADADKKKDRHPWTQFLANVERELEDDEAALLRSRADLETFLNESS